MRRILTHRVSFRLTTACFAGMAIATGLPWVGSEESMAPALAQITPDDTLSTTITSSDNRNFVIEGGRTCCPPTNRENSRALFHSFDEFSIPTNGSAVFDNPTNIDSIFSRVTGAQVSHIDGLIQTNGSADFFLINPNGMVFGPNAQLNVGGSFIGSTAGSIVFADGAEFSARDPQDRFLLTVTTPIGLQFGAAETSLSEASAIQVINTGHTTLSYNLFGFMTGGGEGGLRAANQKTLALLSPAISFENGIISNTAGGHLHLGSPRTGLVGLNTHRFGWSFDYDTITQLGDITFLGQSIIDASGVEGAEVGHVSIQSNNLTFQDGSLIFSQNYGGQRAPSIHIHATGNVNFLGAGNDAPFAENELPVSSGVVTITIEEGSSSDIRLTAQSLVVTEGAIVFAHSLGAGQSGSVDVSVRNGIDLIGGAENPGQGSLIGTAAFAAGRAGDVRIRGQQLQISGDAVLSTATLSEGNSGSILVEMTERIDISGFDSFNSLQSVIVSGTSGAGNAGNIRINTGLLNLREAGRVDSSTVGLGNAGNVTVNATRAIDIRGFEPTATISASGIASSATVFTQNAFGFEGELPTGNAGRVQLTTPILRLGDGAEVAVQNVGFGNGGRLRINADQIILNNAAGLAAFTNEGNGGDLEVRAGSLLVLQKDSLINVESQTIGDGGNISIQAPAIVGLDNSDIVANALKGDGGNITITTQGLFGLTFRDRLTPFNDVTASSEFGLDGTVEINSPDADPNSQVLELPDTLVDVSQLVRPGCSLDEEQFVLAGRGGLPSSPRGLSNGDRPWVDTRNPLSQTHQAIGHANPVERPETTPMQEATGMAFVEHSLRLIAPNGSLQLVATASPTSQNTSIPSTRCTSQNNIH